MAISMAPLLAWSVLATTSVLVVLQLERQCAYNWFAVLSPLWFSDVCLLARAGVHHRRNAAGGGVCCGGHRCGGGGGSRATTSTALYVYAVMCKLAFEVLCAAKLQYYATELSAFVVLAPLWMLCAAAVVNLGARVVAQFRLYNEKLV